MEICRATILGFTLFMAGVALCGFGLWLLLSPAQYRATVRIELLPEPMDINGIGGPVGDSPVYDPYFIQTTFEIIQSEDVLGKVVEAMNLNVEWGRKYAGGGTLTTNESIAILKKHLQIALVRNTKLIEISFTSDDPKEAARIANAIANAYQDYRMERRQQMARNGIKLLEDGFQQEQQYIEAKQKKLEEMRKQLNVPNPEPADELLKSNYPSYFEAKRVLQNNIEFNKLVAAKIESEKLDLQIPKTTMVQIVDLAQPSQFPASPNRFLGAVLLAIGLFPTVGGFLMIKCSRQRSCPAS
jgi:uncharacterized protein involved in exopolysaccharide biosynthesis